jgi:hypothetical protein
VSEISLISRMRNGEVVGFSLEAPQMTTIADLKAGTPITLGLFFQIKGTYPDLEPSKKVV